jgi:diketogulonate reductase-like aldo/keto reductase
VLLAVIPKASSYEHLKENISIFDFELDESDMKAIENLNENVHLCWNPDTVL